MKKIYVPTGNRVLFQAPARLSSSNGDTKIGDIVLPAESAERIMSSQLNPYVETTVLSVGPECKLVKVGDLVVVNRNHVGSMSFPDMQDVAILAETEIIAVVRHEMV